MWMFLKLGFRMLFLRVVKSCYLSVWVVSRTIILIGFLYCQTVKLTLFIRSLCNSLSEIAPIAPVPRAIDDNTTFRQLRNIEVIDAAAFKPRRRRTRSSRSLRII